MQTTEDKEAEDARLRVREWFRSQVLLGIKPTEKGKPRDPDLRGLNASYQFTPAKKKK